MPGEFSNPSYVNPGAGGGGGTTTAVITVANQAARLALLSGNALGRVVKQTSDATVWCLKPNGVPANTADWELIGYSSLGTIAFMDGVRLTTLESSAAITPLAAKATPVDADVFSFADSAAAFALKKYTFANLKAALKTYFDSLYAGGAVAWGNITGKPTTFAPSAHKSSHATGGTDALAPSDIGASATGHSHTWAEIADKPSTFTASAHKSSHATGGADALTPADIGASATGHAHTWAEIADKPSTFTASTHKSSHATGGADALTPADIGAASLSGPAFTGAPAAPTAAPGTNTTQLATTAFVQDAVAGAGGGLPVITRTAAEGAPGSGSLDLVAGDLVSTWYGVAGSLDGVKLVAVAYLGSIYTSVDSGTSWISRGNYGGWIAVASSADGLKLVAAPASNQIATSSDGGVTWTLRGVGRLWKDVASSHDGTKLVACVEQGNIFTSDDSGVTWTSRDSARWWKSVASSADGTKLVACATTIAGNDYIYTSSDSGASWVQRGPARYWISVTSSSDGMKLAASAGSEIHTSTDGGINWTFRALPVNWNKVESSADGNVLVAHGGNYQLGISVDNGVNWKMAGPVRYWMSAALSSDGSKVSAVAYDSFIYHGVQSASVTPQGIAQFCRVGDAAPYDWYQAESVVPVAWRPASNNSTNILTALSSLSAPEITTLRSILESARVMLAP